MKRKKEMKVMKVIEKGINNFSELVLIIGLRQVSNTIDELINLLIEDNLNGKEEETEKEIN